MNIYSNNSWKKVVEILKGDIYRGLTEEECELRRTSSGDNSINFPSGNNIISLAKSFFNIHIILSIAIISILFYFKEYVLAGISLIVFILSLFLKILHLKDQSDKVKFMQKLNNSTTTVLRDSAEKVVKSEELVKGDIVLFSKGSLISADIRIISAKDIKVDEKNITGENFLKDKFDSKIDSNVQSVEEAKNMLFKGSVIKEGEGSGIVVEIGGKTQLGKMFSMLVDAKNNKHTLGKRLEKKVSKYMLIFFIISIVTFFATMNLGQATNRLCLSLFAIEVMPAIVIAFLYFFVLKKELKSKGIDLINISTLDIINDIEILFLDKVGSVTKEEMVVKKLYVNNKAFTAKEIVYNKEITIKRLIETLVLCNDAKYNRETEESSGDLFEVAYLKFADRKMAYKEVLDRENRRIFEVPMDSDKRMITTVNKARKGCRANSKGNVDAILDRCKYIMIDGLEKEITNEEIDKIKAMDYNFSLEGLVTQAVAYRSFSYTPTVEENVENNLVFIGLVAMENPLSDDIHDEIEELKVKGIIPIIFTEDNKITATTLAKKANLIRSNNRVIAGVEIYSLDKDELIDTISKTRVFSRVNPELKARIVGLFVKDNYKVATSGECLGDLPSLTIAKLGIGKGNAPKIIKNASDVYIEKNYLRGFLNLFDVSNKFNRGIGKIESFIYTILLTELAIVNVTNIAFEMSSINYVSIVLLNVLLGIPLSLTLIHSSKDRENRFLLRSILYAGCILGAVYYNPGLVDEFILPVLGGVLLINVLFQCNISFKERNIESILFLISLLLWVGIVGISVFLYMNLFTQTNIIIMCGILIISIIFELISKSWEE